MPFGELPSSVIPDAEAHVWRAEGATGWLRRVRRGGSGSPATSVRRRVNDEAQRRRSRRLGLGMSVGPTQVTRKLLRRPRARQLGPSRPKSRPTDPYKHWSKRTPKWPFEGRVPERVFWVSESPTSGSDRRKRQDGRHVDCDGEIWPNGLEACSFCTQRRWPIWQERPRPPGSAGLRGPSVDVAVGGSSVAGSRPTRKPDRGVHRSRFRPRRQSLIGTLIDADGAVRSPPGADRPHFRLVRSPRSCSQVRVHRGAKGTRFPRPCRAAGGRVHVVQAPARLAFRGDHIRGTYAYLCTPGAG